MSIEEFSVLLRFGAISFFDQKESFDVKTARSLLKRYFKHPLNSEELDTLANFGFTTAQDDWLKAMRHREASFDEIKVMIEKMPWNMLRRFPFELPGAYVNFLFANRNPQKIVAYCRDYALPEVYEKELIENYKQSLKTPDNTMKYTYFGGSSVNGWARALEVYLESWYSDERLTTKDIQQMLLDLNDEKITEKLILRCNIIKNPLHEDVIWRLISEGYVDMVRLMLRESYIVAPPTMVELIEKRMPQVLPQYYIAMRRRATYLKEQQEKIPLGGLTFKEREKWIVNKHQKTAVDEMQDFVLTGVKPWLNSFSPCMCAYLAYWFPDMAEELLKCLSERK